MKTVFKVFLNIIILIFIGLFGYRAYIISQNSEISVDCSTFYSAQINELTVFCDVEDAKNIISSENPLEITIFDSEGSIVAEDGLIKGDNTIHYGSLAYNSLFIISVDGANFIQEAYVSENFYHYEFSTALETLNIPTLSIYEQYFTDTTFAFNLSLTDFDSLVSNITVELFNDQDTLVSTKNIIDFTETSMNFTNLSPESDYDLIVTAYYTINDFDATSTVIETYNFTTPKTPLIPLFTISNISNDYVTLQFDLTMDPQDAENVTYRVDLVDSDSNILDTTNTSETSISFDVSTITGDYQISVIASYIFNTVSYTDVELLSYDVYNNEYSNFFVIPTLSIVDTSLPLTSYNNYDDYVYTYLNEGITDFTIECAAPVNCEVLIESPLYSGIPFALSSLTHPFYDITEINYSYNSNHVVFTSQVRYSDSDIILVNNFVNGVLNSIITPEMTTYEQIITIHDYIINRSSYDVTCTPQTCETDHSAVGIILYDTAVCEGYAHMMDVMLRALRIPTFRLSSETHQWNAVYYNGGWYHLDATWDDPVTTSGTGILQHTYFLITSDELATLDDSTSHDYDTSFYDFLE